MEAATTRTGRKYRKVGGIVLTAIFAALIGGLSVLPASADDDWGRNDHGVRDRDRHYVAPVRVYAPPPVYYEPAFRPPVIDFVFPLTIR